MFRRVTEPLVAELEGIAGRGNVCADASAVERYASDEFALRRPDARPEVVVKPATAAQVAEVLKLANRESFPVVARGGGTGLCGGCVPVFGGVVLSMERMNAVVEIDPADLLARLEAGLSLRDFYAALAAERLFFPPHPGEEGATVGGVVATNAGGSRAVKYGTVRNFVRGLDVVFPDGSAASLGGKVLKDSSGYSLMHLMIGSEGTLGVVTAATLSVMPAPSSTLTLIVPFDAAAAAFGTASDILRAGIVPLAVEFVPRRVIAVSEKHLRKTWPVRAGEYFLMAILDGEESELLGAAEKISDIASKRGAADAFATGAADRQAEILAIRSLVYEALKRETVEILDVVLPRSRMEEHVAFVGELSARTGVWLPTYGHAADGNLHTHLMKTAPDGTPVDGWEETCAGIRREIHADARKRGGRVSGEHGIGFTKREYMALFHDPAALRAMAGIKRLLDPNGILNPGKVLPEGIAP